jgi:hypothetical protein
MVGIAALTPPYWLTNGDNNHRINAICKMLA